MKKIEKKFESQLGNFCQVHESLEDLLQNAEYDAVLLLKDIVPILLKCNDKNPYDCEVMMMAAARMAAMVINALEVLDYNAEDRVKSLIDFDLEHIRKIRNGEEELVQYEI